MNTISLKLKKDDLVNQMEDFYILTGLKTALFDETGNEILSCPGNHCAFCARMRSCPEGNRMCEESNHRSFKRCNASRSIETYRCFAGLTETTAPLVDNDTVIGYAMFGQVTTVDDPSKVKEMLRESLLKYTGDDSADDDSVFNVTYRTERQVQAAARILDACTSYLLFRDIISLQRETFIHNFNSFLMEHLSEDLSVERLTSEFHISKNKLYESCSNYMSTGIAEHIKKLRIAEARRLLKETELSVHEISNRVGFADYNYFCRVFKKETGMSARAWRNSDQ